MPVMNNNLQSVEQLEASFRQDGYEPGIPPGLSVEAQRIDRAVCRRSRCGKCRGRGLHWRPWHRGSSYRIAAVCPVCGISEEM
jgi:hypothetical protein